MNFHRFYAKLELIPESHPVGEKDAVEMVGLVLEDDGGEAADGVTHGIQRVDVHITDDNCLRTFHFPVYFRYEQAAFRSGLFLVGQVLHTDIWIDLERFTCLVESLYGDHPSFQAYLRPCYTDSVLSGIGDRGYHPACKPSEPLRTQSFQRKIGAFRTEYQRILPVNHRQHTHNSICIDDVFFRPAQTGCIIRRTAAHCRQNGHHKPSGQNKIPDSCLHFQYNFPTKIQNPRLSSCGRE